MGVCVEGMLTLRARAAAAATTGQYNKIAGIAIYDRASPRSSEPRNLAVSGL